MNNASALRAARLFALPLLLGWVTQPAHAQTDPFVGTFAADGLVVTIEAAADGYTGRATLAGENFTITGRRTGETTVRGSYDYYGTPIAFELTATARGILVSSEGERYELPRQGPAPSAVPSATPPEPPLGPNQMADPQWGIRFDVPDGWRAVKDGALFLMGSDVTPGLVVIMPHEATTLAELEAGAREGLVDEGTALRLSGTVTRSPDGRAVTARFEGRVDGAAARAYAVGLLPEHETGAVVIAATSPDAFGDEHVGVAESVAASIEYTVPVVPPITMEWRRDLAGYRLTYMWTYDGGVDVYGGYSGGSQRIVIDVCEAGHFSYYNSSSMSIDSGGGDYAVSVGGGGSEQGMGQWSVATYSDGPYLRLSFHDGEVREYGLEWDDSRLYMDGSRYFRTDGSAGGDDGPAC